ncbi:hypothetical protein [uncultured Treponema sp.]|uniref:hypothetical protein n=1 Tax=uncultured Treponema sp. TaxID=162155 RepID=UPI0025F3547D|nr:hypothetical protein [uncultured Treponema sp.]
MRKFVIDDERKRTFLKFSVIFGMVFGMTVILAVFTLVSRNSWKASLAFEVQNVLDSYSDSQFTVSNALQLNSSFSTSAAVYSLLKKDERVAGKYYGVIVRVPSIVGPLPAVFIYREGGGVTFAGYAIDNGKASDTVKLQLSTNVLRYWEDMIPKIVAKTVVVKPERSRK